MTAPRDPAPAGVTLTDDEREELDGALDQFWQGDDDADGVAGTVEQFILEPRLAAAEAEVAVLRGQVEVAWDEGWNAAVESNGFPGDVNPYRAPSRRDVEQ